MGSVTCDGGPGLACLPLSRSRYLCRSGRGQELTNETYEDAPRFHIPRHLGTQVLAMSIETSAEVETNTTDRGPYAQPERRIIDLSRATAEWLGLRRCGVGPVRVMVSEVALLGQMAPTQVVHEVQLGAFRARAAA